MENNTNRNDDPSGTNPQQRNTEYPGYTSDKQWGNANDEFSENDPIRHDIEDARLAESGPVRNPNYHDLTAANSESNELKTIANKKTLQDFNNTNPKRDINKTDLKTKDAEYTDNDQS